MKKNKTARIKACDIRYDDLIRDFTVKKIGRIADGKHLAEPHIVLIKMTRVALDTGEYEERSTWFHGNDYVEVTLSPYRHHEDDNVDSNLRDTEGTRASRDHG